MKTTTDTASAAAITAAARELRLPGIREQHTRLADQAERSKSTYLGFLADTLTLEVDDRAERRRSRRITEAKFPRPKRLADFDLDAAPTVNPATIATLAAGHYLDNGDPVVLLGDSGTGKTHLLIGLGMAACEQGRRVRYTTCRATRQRTQRSRRRTTPRPAHQQIQPHRTVDHRRARLRATRHPRRRTLLPSPHRPRRKIPGSRSDQTCPSANGAKSSPTQDSSPPSSTDSPSTPTSSKPAPTPTDSKPAAPKPDPRWGQHTRAQWGQSGLTFPATQRSGSLSDSFTQKAVARWSRSRSIRSARSRGAARSARHAHWS